MSDFIVYSTNQIFASRSNKRQFIVVDIGLFEMKLFKKKITKR